MNSSVFRFTLDLQEAQSQVYIRVKRGDTRRKWSISICDGGFPCKLAPDVMMATLYISRPTGTTLEAACEVVDNEIIYNFTENTAVVTGLHSCQIVMIDNAGQSIPTPNFNMEVSASNVGIEGTDEDTTEVSAILMPRLAYVTLLASAWVGDEDTFSQVVEIEGVTQYTKVDLQPDAEQLAIFHDKDLAFVTENVGGVVTVYAIGDVPTQDYTIQATLKEVSV